MRRVDNPCAAGRGSVHPWIAAERLSGFVQRMREALLGGRVGVGVNDGAALLASALLFAAGLWVFRRLSPHFQDLV